jgi:hypothetical protein
MSDSILRPILWLGAGLGAAYVASRLLGGKDTIIPGAEGYMVAKSFDGGVGWARVMYNGQEWEVSPSYIAPVGIGEAAELAEANGAQLPVPGLVDAIWKAADLKVAPLPRQHDGTPATMASQAAFDDQYARIQKQIAGRSYRLLAGTHKDVVRDPRTGKLGLYGWHQLDGSVIQPLFTGHSEAWIDYSQGLRLVRPVSLLSV